MPRWNQNSIMRYCDKKLQALLGGKYGHYQACVHSTKHQIDCSWSLQLFASSRTMMHTHDFYVA